MKPIKIFRLLALFPLLLASACDRSTEAGCSDLIVSDAWIRAMPPGPSVTAGYLQIENHGQAAITVEGFSSPDFKRVEMHETRNVDGQMQMRQLQSLEIPQGDIAQMAPGGKHLMLFDPAKALHPGESRELVLHCKNGKLPLKADVRSIKTSGANAGTAHSEHGHH